MRNVSPGHIELWFWGWTLHHYRKTFPLWPFPVATFIPFIVNSIKPLEDTLNPEKPAIVTIDVARNSMIINTNTGCSSQTYDLPFIGVKNFCGTQKPGAQIPAGSNVF